MTLVSTSGAHDTIERPTIERIGIIDLGSNSSRLVIYEVSADTVYQPLFEMKHNLRLAKDVARNRQIAPASIERIVACLRIFLHTGKMYEVTSWFPVATAAIRQAENRDEVVDVVLAETGLSFRVLNGSEESRYGYLGVANSLPVTDALLVDIGGASSEIVEVRDRQLANAISLPFGALNLTELFRRKPATAVGERVQALMKRELDQIPWLKQCSGLPVIGLGGTARALGKVHQSRYTTRSQTLHGYPIPALFLHQIFDEVRRLDAAKRRKLKGLSKGRADIVIAGFGALSSIAKHIDSPHLLVSNHGLREGIFYEYLFRRQPVPLAESVLHHSLTNFKQLYHVDTHVSDSVAAASVYLFDALRGLHSMSDVERRLLWVTAQVESCGCYIHTEKWTRHSAYLVLTSHLYGLSHQEFGVVADLLNGKGKSPVGELRVILRLAKLLVLQLGISAEEIMCQITNNLILVGTARHIEQTVAASADAELPGEFAKTFGRRLAFVEVMP